MSYLNTFLPKFSTLQRKCLQILLQICNTATKNKCLSISFPNLSLHLLCRSSVNHFLMPKDSFALAQTRVNVTRYVQHRQRYRIGFSSRGATVVSTVTSQQEGPGFKANTHLGLFFCMCVVHSGFLPQFKNMHVR